MNTNIPSNADPRPAINKILAHFTRLKEHKLNIPEQLKVLMLLSKAPPSMEVMVQVASREAATKNIGLSEVYNGMITSWQNYGWNGNQGNCQDVVQSSQLLPSLLSPTQVVPHILFILWPLWRYDIYVHDPCPGLLPSHHHHDSTPRLPLFPTNLWEVPFGRSLYDSLWEVGGCLLFGPVRSPCPSSLALETLPEEQDFLWRYWHTLICQTCCNRNRCLSSIADNPNLSLFGPPGDLAVYLIFYYYFSYLIFYYYFSYLSLSRLRWSPVIIGCQVYP